MNKLSLENKQNDDEDDDDENDDECKNEPDFFDKTPVLPRDFSARLDVGVFEVVTDRDFLIHLSLVPGVSHFTITFHIHFIFISYSFHIHFIYT